MQQLPRPLPLWKTRYVYNVLNPLGLFTLFQRSDHYHMIFDHIKLRCGCAVVDITNSVSCEAFTERESLHYMLVQRTEKQMKEEY